MSKPVKALPILEARPPVEFLKQVIRANRSTPLLRALAKFSDRYLKIYMNEGFWDMERNGENLLIEKFVETYGTGELVIFDVGANQGDWTARIRSMIPGSKCHTFELAPDTAAILAHRFAQDNHIRINAAGLSDKAGVIQYKSFGEGSVINNINGLNFDSLEHQIREAKIMRGDEYVAENGVELIHLLKVDTEGHEMAVLKGFENAFRQNRILSIQFEHGATNIPSRALLADFYAYLTPFGFALGRLYPQGVEFKDYDPFNDEQFRMGNYVAVHTAQAQNFLKRLSLP